jgi:hypothetical protein
LGRSLARRRFSNVASQLAGRAPSIRRWSGGPVERSLFAPVQESELNGESDVAVYLEGEKALVWWHRRVALNHNASRWRAEAVDSTTSTQATEVLKFLSSNFE